MNVLGGAHLNAGRTDDAMRLEENALQLGKARLGPDRRETLTSMNNLAKCYIDVGQTNEAIRLFEEALKVRTAKWGADDPGTLIPAVNLASAYRDSGRSDDAVRVLEEAFGRRQTKPRSDTDPNVVAMMPFVVDTYRRSDRLQDALPILEAELPANALTWQVRGELHAGHGQPDQAAEEFLKAIDLSSDELKPRSSETDRVRVCSELARLDQAFDRVCEFRPDEPAVWIGRAQRRVLQGHWNDALADYAKVIESCAVSNETDEYAWLLLLVNDRSRYRKFCQGVVARRRSHSIHSSPSTWRVPALLPLENVGGAQLVQWAEQGAKADARPWFIHALALRNTVPASSRRPSKSAEKSNAANWGTGATSPKQGPKAQNWLVMAMSHYRLGHAAEANECLATAPDRRRIPAQEARRAGRNAPSRLDRNPSPAARSRCAAERQRLESTN